MAGQGVVSDAITYSTVISACEKGKQPERALLVSAVMVQQDVVPNTITYNALISACVKDMQPEQAVKVLEALM